MEDFWWIFLKISIFYFNVLYKFLNKMNFMCICLLYRFCDTDFWAQEENHHNRAGFALRGWMQSLQQVPVFCAYGEPCRRAISSWGESDRWAHWWGASADGVQERHWKGPRCSKLAFFQEKGVLCGGRLREKDPVSQSLSVRRPMALSVFLMRNWLTAWNGSCWRAVKRGLMDLYLFNLRKK